MLNKAYVVIIGGACTVHQAAQVSHILPHDLSDFVQLGQLVPIVQLKHALRADQLLANTAEVLNNLACMLRARDLACLVGTSVKSTHRVRRLGAPVRAKT